MVTEYYTPRLFENFGGRPKWIWIRIDIYLRTLKET